MNQLTHWNPFKPLVKFEAPSTFDDFFRGFGLRPAWRDFEAMPDIKIDVTEDDKAYKVKADIPGVKKNDISVSVEGRQVEINAEMKQESEKKEGSCLYSERSEGRVFRSFMLPMEVDSKDAEAKYDDGVLTLTLPKHVNGKGRRITIM